MQARAQMQRAGPWEPVSPSDAGAAMDDLGATPESSRSRASNFGRPCQACATILHAIELLERRRAIAHNFVSNASGHPNIVAEFSRYTPGL